MTELLDVSTEPVKTAQTEAPGTEPTSWMPLSDEARNTAPETIKGLFEAKKWSSMEDLANGYVDLEKVLGRGEHIFKPEDPNNVDAMEKYWQQITGISNENEYEYEADEAVPFNDVLMDRFRKFSKKIHLNKEQSADVVQFQRDIIKEVIAADVQANEQAEAQTAADLDVVRKALVTKAGGEVAYQNMMVEARQVADELGIYQTLEKKGLASDPEIIGMLQDIKDRTKEGVILKGTPPDSVTKDPLVELEEIKKSEAFTKRFHPQHKAIMIRFMELNNVIANSGLAPKRTQDG